MLLPLAIAVALVTQAPAPPEAAPVDAAPLVAAPVEAAPVSPAPVTNAAPGFFDDGQPGHYLSWYGAEYVVVLGLGTLLATGALENVEPLPASIGPSISLTSPELSLLFDPRLDDVIGKPILQEKVPTPALGVGIAAAIVAAAGVDFAGRQDLHRTHAIVLGGLEAVLGAAVITEGMKLGFGRLRPDFRERYVRAACLGVVSTPTGLDCTGVGSDGFEVDHELLVDGMKSFPSGHSSTSFAAATFLALQIGGEHLWSSHASEWARPIAGLAVGGLLAGAGYVSASRVSDHRHHLEDVAVGSAIGIASGTAAYFIHFDSDGRARRRGAHREEATITSIVPIALEGGAGAAVLGRF